MTEYDIVKADDQIIRLSNGNTFENKLIDCSTGNGITLYIQGSATIRNVGFKGLYKGGDFCISIKAPNGGDILLENIYLGDGCTKQGESFVHGPGAVFMHKNSTADITARHCNVQGFTNNGFYCSNTAHGGSVTFERCFGKNNGVSTFRCASSRDTIRECVAYNDHTDYGPGYNTNWVESNGRPFWVWNGGEVTIEDSEFAAGPYPHAGITHTGGKAAMRGGAVDGNLQGNISTSGVGSNPSLEPPKGVPMSAEEAASGSEGDSDWEYGGEDGWGQEHVYELLNPSEEKAVYYLEADDEANFSESTYNGADESGVKWADGPENRVAGKLDPGDHHAWELDSLLLDVVIEGPATDEIEAFVNDSESNLDRYPLADASGRGWTKSVPIGLGDDDEDEDEDEGGLSDEERNILGRLRDLFSRQ